MARRWLKSLPPGRLRLYAATAVIALVAGGCCAVLIAIELAQQAPAWWISRDWETPQAGHSAMQLENRLMTTIHQVRPVAEPAAEESATWTVPVSAADANAWLNARMPRWLPNQSDSFEWPKQIEELQVEFQDDTIRVGMKVRYAESSQFLSATLRPAIRESDGSLWMPASVVSIGRLPLPATWLLSGGSGEIAQEQIPEDLRELPELKSLASVFAGQVPAARTPVLRLADGRRVRLVSLTSRDGMLEVTCQTEPRQVSER